MINLIVNLVIWFYQNTALKYLPTDMPGITIDSFSSSLTNFTSTVGAPLYILNKVFPWNVLISLIIAFISLELILWVIRALITGWNMMRGSGARV